jgi:hypothetical protein
VVDICRGVGFMGVGKVTIMTDDPWQWLG